MFLSPWPPALSVSSSGLLGFCPRAHWHYSSSSAPSLATAPSQWEPQRKAPVAHPSLFLSAFWCLLGWVTSRRLWYSLFLKTVSCCMWALVSWPPHTHILETTFEKHPLCFCMSVPGPPQTEHDLGTPTFSWKIRPYSPKPLALNLPHGTYLNMFPCVVVNQP